MESEDVKAFNAELTKLYSSSLPVSKARINEVANTALRASQHYKHVVFCMEKFIAKCNPQFKISCLYILDSIIRKSQHVHKEKDVWGPRFQKNMEDTIVKLLSCPPADKLKVPRTIHLWRTYNVYPAEVIGKFLAVCQQAGVEIDLEIVERAVKGERANLAVYETGKPRDSHRSSKSSKDKKHRERVPASTPPEPAEDAPTFEPSNETPADGVSESFFLLLIKKAGFNHGNVFSTDISLLRRAYADFLPLLQKRIERVQQERGEDIKQLISRDFDYSDDEEVKEEPPKQMQPQEIEELARQLFTEVETQRNLDNIYKQRVDLLNKVAQEAKQRTAAVSQPMPSFNPAFQNLQPGPNGLPPSSVFQAPQMQLPPNVTLATPLSTALNPMLNFQSLQMNLLSHAVQQQLPGFPPNPMLPNLQSPANIMANLAAIQKQQLGQGMPGPSFMPPGGPPPQNFLHMPPNLPSMMQMPPPDHSKSETMQLMERAMEEQRGNSSKASAFSSNTPGSVQQQERDRRDRGDRRRDDDRGRGSSDRRRRSNSKERYRDRDKDRDRRRRSRSRDRVPRDPRDSREPGRSDYDRDRRRDTFPPLSRPEHLTIASCTLWFGRLPPSLADEDFKESLRDIGLPKRIFQVNSRACAYVTMNDRKTAQRVLEKRERNMTINGKSVKISWAMPNGIKRNEAQFNEFWVGDQGIAYVPWNRLPGSLRPLVEGSWLDVETLPPHLRGKVDENGVELPNMAQHIAQMPFQMPPNTLHLPPQAGMVPMMPAPFGTGPRTPSKPPPSFLDNANGLPQMPNFAKPPFGAGSFMQQPPPPQQQQQQQPFGIPPPVMQHPPPMFAAAPPQPPPPGLQGMPQPGAFQTPSLGGLRPPRDFRPTGREGRASRFGPPQDAFHEPPPPPDPHVAQQPLQPGFRPGNDFVLLAASHAATPPREGKPCPRTPPSSPPSATMFENSIAAEKTNSVPMDEDD